MTDDFGWTEAVEKVCDAAVKRMSREELERIAWDTIFEEVSLYEWADIVDAAETYGLDPESL
jgi:hypothetical protein